MQWSLFVLILMSQCSFFTCHLYEYHFIKDNKNWTEAQSYCRKHYTDLATVSNMRDMERLRDTVKTRDKAWIGLHNRGDGNRTWYWSLPGVEFNESETKRILSQPDESEETPAICDSPEDTDWIGFSCLRTVETYICYNETTKQYNVSDNPMTWSKAECYCSDQQSVLIGGLTKVVDKFFWIGLFRDTWMWSDGSSFSFRHWDKLPKPDSEKCAVMSNEGWSSDECHNSKPFFCYDDKVILIKENKTWDEALAYCRAEHQDLVSIINQDQQKWVEKRAKKADTPFVWVGMRYTSTLRLWFWVSDHLVCYDNWGTNGNTETSNKKAAAMCRKGGKWFAKDDTMKFNFICTLQ